MPIIFCQKFFRNDGKKHCPRCHASPQQCYATLLEKRKVNILPHPPYSPDLAPCDFFLFSKIKKELKNKKYNKVENLAWAVQAIISSILKEEYHRSFEDWQRIRMLAEIVFEKINFGKQFRIHNIFHIKKQPSISAIKLMDPNNFRYNFGISDSAMI